MKHDVRFQGISTLAFVECESLLACAVQKHKGSWNPARWGLENSDTMAGQTLSKNVQNCTGKGLTTVLAVQERFWEAGKVQSAPSEQHRR